MGIKSFLLKNKSDLIFILIVLILFSLFNHNFSILHIRGSSMFPTYADRDILMLKNKDTIKVNDIVVFQPPESWDNNGKLFIKRVIGVEGDIVEINGKELKINNKLIPHQRENMCEFPDDKLTITIGKNQYFVMGDNLQNSNDSLTQRCLGNKDLLVSNNEIKTQGTEFFLMEGIFK